MCGKSITLITTVYNEGDNILSFLDSYLKQSYYADEFIIVDGGSTDNTIQQIQKYAIAHPILNIKLIVDETCSKKNSIAPIAKGRNVAITAARGELITVTDAGCRLDEHWLEEVTRPFFSENADAICGYYVVNAVREFEKQYAVAFQPLDDNFLPSSRSIAFKKKVWEEVGGYPELSYTAEDTLFDLNILKQGYSFYRAPKAIVYWTFAKSEKDMFKKLREYGKGEGKLLIYKKKAVFRLLTLICPLLIPIIAGIRKRNANFKTTYLFYFYQTCGYIQGMWLRWKR